jgi:ubiquinone/menaquinone biosynthesis C-methylase UbiE
LEHGISLKRKPGEGSFVGIRKPIKPGELAEWFRHLYAYRYATNFAHKGVVLDIGCGAGYGVNELSVVAQTIIGIDIWRDGIYYAHRKYMGNGNYLIASALNLPFRDSCFDLVTSFQVIEHIEGKDVNRLLTQVSRVLKDDGVFIVTTPNRRLRLLPFQKPWNPEHKKEYDYKEFEIILKKFFSNVQIFGLFATKDVYYVEYRRVKQDPFIVYLLKPLYSMMKIVPGISFKIVRKIINIRKISERRRKNNKILTSLKISLNDFKLSTKSLDSSLDLYGML